MNERISVLIPTYNRTKYIEESVRSIMNQTYENLSIVIYDDGSTDNTPEIISKLLKEDNRITYVYYPINHGGVYAKCQLLNLCDTDIVCYQDSDDISESTRIEKQVDALVSFNQDACFCGWNWLKGGVGKTRGAGTIMFRLDKDILPNPEFVLGGGDSEWIDRYLEVHSLYSELDEVLYHIRNHKDRIGVWKKKIRNKVPKELIKTLSYSELIKYYKENYER